MELVEIRDLDGPNLFALEPVIKLECSGIETGDTRVAEIARAIADLHAAIGLRPPSVGVRPLDHEGYVAVFFPWEWRTAALAIAAEAFSSVVDGSASPDLANLRVRLDEDSRQHNVPLWVRDAERKIFAVGVTGTNGKTTTTRLLAHIASTAGKHVGWCSSTGVYVDGECVIEGDYTGPSGARAVLEDSAYRYRDSGDGTGRPVASWCGL